MIHVGFTGTRHGMTLAQLDAVVKLAERLSAVDQLCAHHGDCVGADAEFHEVMRRFARTITIHPPVDGSHRAHCHGDHAPVDPRCDVQVLPAFTHLARNRHIVDVATVMIATPCEPVRQPRGGTWYTVDYSKKVRKPLAIVLPAPSGVMLEFSEDWTWMDKEKS